MNNTVKDYLNGLSFDNISDDRKVILEEMVSYIEHSISEYDVVKFNFICTHNSRRSQFSQLWAQAAADVNGIPAKCYSGGVEITAFNTSAVNALKGAGFEISKEGEVNPEFTVKGVGGDLIMFSKTYDDASSPTLDFAAIMTCSHADENCPYIPGADARISLRYEDPKRADGTPEEEAVYAETSEEIATELMYVFTEAKQRI